MGTLKTRPILLVSGLMASGVLAASQLFSDSEHLSEPIVHARLSEGPPAPPVSRHADDNQAGGVAFLEDRTKLISGNRRAAPASFFGQPKPAIVAAKPEPKSPSAPSDTLPPLPFTYLGRSSVEGQERVFLTDGTSTYLVSGGEVVNGDYVLKSFDGSVLTFTYTPLHQDQTLTIE